MPITMNCPGIGQKPKKKLETLPVPQSSRHLVGGAESAPWGTCSVCGAEASAGRRQGDAPSRSAGHGLTSSLASWMSSSFMSWRSAQRKPSSSIQNRARSRSSSARAQSHVSKIWLARARMSPVGSAFVASPRGGGLVAPDEKPLHVGTIR
jgi:hypothetical protein